MTEAIYPGSFDPLTYGHLDLIRRAVKVFGALTVAVARNPKKKTLFTPAERVRMIERETKDIPGVRVVAFEGLVVDFCRKEGFQVVLRGVRTVSDFEYEYQMALTNRHLAEDVETVFMMPSARFGFVSSTLIRDVLYHGGDVSAWLPPQVVRELRERLDREEGRS